MGNEDQICSRALSDLEWIEIEGLGTIDAKRVMSQPMYLLNKASYHDTPPLSPFYSLIKRALKIDTNVFAESFINVK
jgi:hypothetical protein